MKKRVADIVADILFENKVTDVFSVVGGGAMFLNDALASKKELTVTYNHHEQACSMAAEGYVRASSKMAAVCVTTGPGGTNAITGVLGAYQDNYPMIVISGQVRITTASFSTGLPLRFMGEQEHDIVSTVKSLTKYAKVILNPQEIRYEMEKAIYIANHGRKGPVWLDIPLDVQSAIIESRDLKKYDEPVSNTSWDVDAFISEIRKAKKPVILVGSAVRSTNSVERFRKLTEKLGIPVLAATYNADIMDFSNPCYYGNFGINGGRAGNFIVQNADLIIGMGCRMTFRHIGFNYEAFSPKSRRMIVDVDEAELQKPTLRIDVPICTDIENVIDTLLYRDDVKFEDSMGWIEYCDRLKLRFPIYLDKFGESDAINPYFFIKELQKILSDDAVIVLGNSSIAGHVLQMGIVNSNQRIINNMNTGSMGYDLPAAIGATVATKKEVTLITGDGSIMMNLQELMTIKHYDLPIKIFICNNGGYRAIVRTQTNMFNGIFTGCTPETGVGLPEFSKVAYAFDIPFFKIENHADISKLNDFYDTKGFAICEIMQDCNQVIEPRTMSKKLEDGTLVSSPIDDLYPFLNIDEYDEYKTVKK